MDYRRRRLISYRGIDVRDTPNAAFRRIAARRIRKAERRLVAREIAAALDPPVDLDEGPHPLDYLNDHGGLDWLHDFHPGERERHPMPHPPPDLGPVDSQAVIVLTVFRNPDGSPGRCTAVSQGMDRYPGSAAGDMADVLLKLMQAVDKSPLPIALNPE